MSRINCHSAFRHYEMFHGHGACGGGSYGSVFNTTYNINCGGHAGFWGGFGFGLGNFVGNLFGGFMGNMGFGGFGFSGSGFGFPNFGGSWFGGGGSNQVSNSHSSNTTTCHCKGCKDDDNIAKKNEDYAKLNKLFERKNNILAKTTPDLEDLKTLKSDIEALEDNLDGNDDTNDKNYIEQLKKGLDEKISELEQSKEPVAEEVSEEVPVEGTVPPASTTTPPPTEEESLTDKINDASDINALLDALPDGGYASLTGADKAAFDKKFGDLLNGMSEDDRFALLDNPKLPEELKAKVKQSFYKTGYTNYDGQQALNNGDVILAHDMSGSTRDTVQASRIAISTITKSDNGHHPKTIVIHDRKDITYTYKETVDGEYIYTSNQDNQEYVLQKNSQGKFELIQYRYHKGYGEKDWS